jgi:phosphoesterase RecJ-like protein
VTLPSLSEEITEAQQRVCEAIREHHSFLVCGHVRPDGDCLGSQIGLGLGLRSLGKQVRLFSSGPIPRHLQFIPSLELVETALDPAFRPEVTIICDSGRPDRVCDGFTPEGLVINIDHHVSNSRFGDVVYVDASATAVGEQVYHILRELGAEISEAIATCLYLTLMSDTGSFKYANTSHRTFEIATDLVRSGANPSWVASSFYDNLSRGTLWLKGQVLANMHHECDGRLCWAEITQEMYRHAGGESAEPEGLVSEMRSIEGVEVSVLIHELAGGGARAGFRSRGTWDVNTIASELGGGGHHNASGCFLPGDYGQVRERILAVARRHLASPRPPRAR